MSDPKILQQHLRSCDDRSRNVHCPHKEIPANITAANENQEEADEVEENCGEEGGADEKGC